MNDDFGAPERVDNYSEPMSGENGGNALGIVGFVLSLTCLLSPIGFLVSLFALRKAPRGFAIAGTVVGLVLTLVVGGGVAAFMAGVNNAGATIMAGVQADAQLWEQQIAAYESETGQFPASVDDVAIPPQTLEDPWGNTYRYELGGAAGWTVMSAGPDGVFDTADDFDPRDLTAMNQFGPEFQTLVESWNEAAEAGNEPAGNMISAIGEAATAAQWIQVNHPDSAVINPPAGGDGGADADGEDAGG